MFFEICIFQPIYGYFSFVCARKSFSWYFLSANKLHATFFWDNLKPFFVLQYKSYFCFNCQKGLTRRFLEDVCSKSLCSTSPPAGYLPYVHCLPRLLDPLHMYNTWDVSRAASTLNVTFHRHLNTDALCQSCAKFFVYCEISTYFFLPSFFAALRH